MQTDVDKLYPYLFCFHVHFLSPSFLFPVFHSHFLCFLLNSLLSFIFPLSQCYYLLSFVFPLFHLYFLLSFVFPLFLYYLILFVFPLFHLYFLLSLVFPSFYLFLLCLICILFQLYFLCLSHSFSSVLVSVSLHF